METRSQLSWSLLSGLLCCYRWNLVRNKREMDSVGDCIGTYYEVSDRCYGTRSFSGLHCIHGSRLELSCNDDDYDDYYLGGGVVDDNNDNNNNNNNADADDTISHHIQDQLRDQCCDLPSLQLMYSPHVDRDIVFRGGNQAWVVYL